MAAVCASGTFEAAPLTIGLTSIEPSMLTSENLAAANKECADHRTASRDPERTVFERAEASRKYLRCIEVLSSAYVLTAQKSLPLDQVVAVQSMTTSIVNEAKEFKIQSEAKESFLDLSWGLGFGFSFGLDDAIEDAELVDGVIRVTEDKTDQPRAVLEFHRYPLCNDGEKNGNRGCGPFLAVAASPDKVLSGVAVGFMFGFRSKKPEDKEGFSIGIGAILDADVKTLADGFEEDEPLPPGETEIRFEKSARWSGLFFVTRSF